MDPQAPYIRGLIKDKKQKKKKKSEQQSIGPRHNTTYSIARNQFLRKPNRKPKQKN